MAKYQYQITLLEEELSKFKTYIAVFNTAGMSTKSLYELNKKNIETIIGFREAIEILEEKGKL